MSNRPTVPVPAQPNRLSDAPSAGSAHGGDQASFCDGLVTAKDLSTVFQPIVRLDSGELFAYETLVRCRVPGFAPSDDPIFSHDHDIYLEITESVPLSHFDLCVSVLREVCARTGAHLVIDDLGAGYSNLKLIADLEPKVVKLDRALVQNLHRKPRQRKLVSMICQLCSELGATVVAEGIETNDEFRAVCDSGAEYGQGFLFARPSFPMPPIVWPPLPSDAEQAAS